MILTEQDRITQMEKKRYHSWKHYFRIGITAFLTIAACITFYFILERWDRIAQFIDTISVSAQPITIGLVLTYLLLPVKKFVEKPVFEWLISKKVDVNNAKKWSSNIGITGALIFLFVIIAVLIAMMVPALVDSVVGLVESMPGYVESFVEWIESKGIGNSELVTFIINTITSITGELQDWAKTELLPIAQQYIAHITTGVFSVVKAIINFLIGIIIVVYVMTIQDTLLGQCKKIIYAIFPAKKANTIIKTFRKSNAIFGGFVIGKIIDSAIIGVIAYLGCVILQIPSAFLVAFIIGVTNIIPFFGPFIGAIPTLLIVLIQSPIHALYLRPGLHIILTEACDASSLTSFSSLVPNPSNIVEPPEITILL